MSENAGLDVAAASTLRRMSISGVAGHRLVIVGPLGLTAMK
jgi:hypothetical protein